MTDRTEPIAQLKDWEDAFSTVRELRPVLAEAALLRENERLREVLEEIVMLLRATDRLKVDGFADQAARLASEALTDEKSS